MKTFSQFISEEIDPFDYNDIFQEFKANVATLDSYAKRFVDIKLTPVLKEGGFEPISSWVRFDNNAGDPNKVNEDREIDMGRSLYSYNFFNSEQTPDGPIKAIIYYSNTHDVYIGKKTGDEGITEGDYIGNYENGMVMPTIIQDLLALTAVNQYYQITKNKIDINTHYGKDLEDI